VNRRRGLRRAGCGGFSLVLLLSLAACDQIVDAVGGGGQGSYRLPTEVAPGMRFSAVGAGGFHTCATAVEGGVYCWGKSEFGELGGPAPPVCSGTPMGDVPCTGTPQRVVDAPPLHRLTGSMVHTCGLDAEGVAWCWGIRHALGDGMPSGSPDDTRVPCSGPPGFTATCRAFAAPVRWPPRYRMLQAAVDGPATCGASDDHHGWCWNVSRPADMGLGSPHVPTSLPSDLRFESVVHQGMVACGLVQGEAWCWGSNWHGSLGIGSAAQGTRVHPVGVNGGHAFTGLALTPSSVCGIRVDGETWCWGSLPGHGPPRYGTAPVRVAGPAFVAIEGGGNHHCGLTGQGDAWCWGTNGSGYLGDGTLQDRADPTRVRAPSGVRFQALALGGVHTCGLATDGRLFCWGNNQFGQVGRPPP